MLIMIPTRQATTMIMKMAKKKKAMLVLGLAKMEMTMEVRKRYKMMVTIYLGLTPINNLKNSMEIDNVTHNKLRYSHG